MAGFEVITEGKQLRNRFFQVGHSGALPSLARFPALRHLSLANDPLHGLDGLPNFPSLETLDLANTDISDTDLAAVGRLASLRQLNISENAIAGTGRQHFASLTKLTELTLDQDDMLTDDALAALSTISSLEKLSLCGAGADGEGLNALLSLREP